MVVRFIEVLRVGLFKKSLKELGFKEMTSVPNVGDIIHRKDDKWEVVWKRFIFDSDQGDYVQIFMKPIK